jgi:hypothetical protein
LTTFICISCFVCSFFWIYLPNNLFVLLQTCLNLFSARKTKSSKAFDVFVNCNATTSLSISLSLSVFILPFCLYQFFSLLSLITVASESILCSLIDWRSCDCICVLVFSTLTFFHVHYYPKLDRHNLLQEDHILWSSDAVPCTIQYQLIFVFHVQHFITCT